MTWLRSAAFQALFYGWTLVLGVLYLPLLILPRGGIVRGGRWWCRTVFALLAATVGLRHRVVGAERLPPGPSIYAIKHQSAWDTLFLTQFVHDPAIVLKKELLRIPIFGWYLWKHDMIPVDRKAGTKALKQLVADAREKVAAGRSPIVFPEGTRSAVGASNPYQPGIAALYRDLGLPVVPVALNSGLFWARREFVKRPGTITVEVLDPIPPGLPRKEFTAELERRIETSSRRLAGTFDPAELSPAEIEKD